MPLAAPARNGDAGIRHEQPVDHHIVRTGAPHAKVRQVLTIFTSGAFMGTGKCITWSGSSERNC